MTEERPRNESYLQIGEVADRTGVTQRTLRFYEERGLLKPPTRLEGGFRLYSEEDVSRVEQIRRLQGLLGLSLADIKEMVEAEEVIEELRATFRPDREPEERIKRIDRRIEVTERQVAIVAGKLSALKQMKQDLEQQLKRAKTNRAELEKQVKQAGPGQPQP